MSEEKYDWKEYKKNIFAELICDNIYKHIPNQNSCADHWVSGRCPFHDDTKNSFSYSRKTLGWKCFAGCGQGSVFDYLMKLNGTDFKTTLLELGRKYNIPSPDSNKNENQPISTSIVSKWHEQLLNDSKMIRLLLERRNLKLETIVAHQIGIDLKKNRFTIPIKDHNGTVRNIRLSSFTEDPKMLNYVNGNNKYGSPPRLFGLPELVKNKNGKIIICEGEFDRLILEQEGFVAVTGTHGCSTFPKEWVVYFKGRDVVIIFDCDIKGQEAAKRVMLLLYSSGVRSIKNVILPLSGTSEDNDITDYFLKNKKSAKDLQNLIDIASYYKPSSTSEIDTEPIYSDLSNSKMLVKNNSDSILFVADAKRWLTWNECRWEYDANGEIYRRAKLIGGEMKTQLHIADDKDEKKSLKGWVRYTESKNGIQAMIKLAESEARMYVQINELDSSSFLFNCVNGTINLKNGECQPHNRLHKITKLSPATFQENTNCPLWLKFLSRILGGNPELISFLQRAVGYSLTGETGEQCLFFLHGIGANGKSTFLDVVSHLFGDYSKNTPTETLIMKPSGGIPNDLARLPGSRLVTAVETEEGRRLAEVLVKQLTGGDIITARFLHKEFFDFKPTFKIFLAANHRPEIRGTDHAIWRRIYMIPFHVTIPKDERDRELSEKLKCELSGILNWAIQGCLDWQDEGLNPPPEVLAATELYRNESDIVGNFITERCSILANARVGATVLYTDFKEWCEKNGEQYTSQKRFAGKLKEKGLRNDKRDGLGRTVWSGIGLRADPDIDEVEFS